MFNYYIKKLNKKLNNTIGLAYSFNITTYPSQICNWIQPQNIMVNVFIVSEIDVLFH